MIKNIFDINKKCYGYRRITEELKNEYGVIMNGKKVLRIMKKYNIQAEYIRKTKIKHKNKIIEDNVQPNLLKRNFNTNALNKIWDTDVTYIIYKELPPYSSTTIVLQPYKNIVNL